MSATTQARFGCFDSESCGYLIGTDFDRINYEYLRLGTHGSGMGIGS